MQAARFGHPLLRLFTLAFLPGIGGGIYRAGGLPRRRARCRVSGCARGLRCRGSSLRIWRTPGCCPACRRGGRAGSGRTHARGRAGNSRWLPGPCRMAGGCAADRPGRRRMGSGCAFERRPGAVLASRHHAAARRALPGVGRSRRGISGWMPGLPCLCGWSCRRGMHRMDAPTLGGLPGLMPCRGRLCVKALRPGGRSCLLIQAAGCPIGFSGFSCPVSLPCCCLSGCGSPG